MSCSIRYRRSRRPDDVGLVIVKQAEVPAYTARLEASGYVVLEATVTPPAKLSPEASY